MCRPAGCRPAEIRAKLDVQLHATSAPSNHRFRAEPDGRLKQGTTGPKILQGPPSRGQPHGEGNVLNAAQLQGLQSDALRMSTIREGCPQHPLRQLRASGLAHRDL